LNQGCRIFLGATQQNVKYVPNNHKIYQIITKYTKIPQNIPNGYYILINGHKIYQHFPFQGPQKSSQIGILGMKIYHLATLV
jgi:hypothetical protein